MQHLVQVLVQHGDEFLVRLFTGFQAGAERGNLLLQFAVDAFCLEQPAEYLAAQDAACESARRAAGDGGR